MAPDYYSMTDAMRDELAQLRDETIAEWGDAHGIECLHRYEQMGDALTISALEFAEARAPQATLSRFVASMVRRVGELVGWAQ